MAKIPTVLVSESREEVGKKLRHELHEEFKLLDLTSDFKF